MLIHPNSFQMLKYHSAKKAADANTNKQSGLT